jgi:alpha-tubulin suppressor-like RCC1 family protein
MLCRSRLAPLTLLLIAAACVDDGDVTGVAPAGPAPAWSISDASHGGNAHFAFLPPLVAAVALNGAFDAAITPEVRICTFASGSCAGPDIAVFTMSSGTGSEVVRVDPVAENYIVNWHTGDFALSTSSIYRIRVYASGQLLGFADVDPVDGGKGLKNASTGENIGLKDGSTLPIKFRIEAGAVITNPPPVFSTDERDPIAAGSGHSCGLVVGGAGYCWGGNAFGEQGLGMTGAASALPAAVLASPFTQIVGGSSYACGLDAGGAAYCWGANADGQLGRGTTTTNEPTPAAVSGGHVFAALATGGFFACGRTTGGEIWCWGDNGAGQLGNGGFAKSATPVKVLAPGNPTFAWLDVGLAHACALTASGEAWCWGSNTAGQLGRGFTSTSEAVPAVAIAGTAFRSVAGGGQFTCGITTGNATLCWGANAAGQLGRGTFTTAETSAAGLSSTPVYARIYAGFFHACGITLAGEAQCWGQNDWGQLGTGSATTLDPFGVADPTPVAGGDVFVALSAGLVHTCGITSSRVAKCWGANFSRQLGDPAGGVSASPLTVSGGLSFAKP